MADIYETEIELPIKVYFELHMREPMTRHSPGVPSHIDIEAIEIYGKELPWEICKVILDEHELEEEILEKAGK